MKNYYFSLLILLMISNASAFGVGSFYSDSNPFVVVPGETKETYIVLQNLVGDQNMVASVEIISGKDIAKIVGNQSEYSVPLGNNNVIVNIEIKVPSGYNTGNYNVTLFVKSAPLSQKGQLELSQGINFRMPVKVQKSAGSSIGKIDSGTIIWILSILALLILVAIVYIIVRKSLKEREFYSS